MVLVYVDDLIITGDDEECIAILKQELDRAFTIKDLGLMRYFLGIEVSRSPQGTMLNQRKYILDLLEDTGLDKCKASRFPLQKGLRLSTDTGELLTDPERYRRIIGRLLYLNLTRPDISYSVQQLSQFMQAVRKPHLQAALHVISYLKGTSDWGLFYSATSELHITEFCDADWGTCAYSGRSLTGYCIFLGESLIS